MIKDETQTPTVKGTIREATISSSIAAIVMFHLFPPDIERNIILVDGSQKLTSLTT